MRSKERDRRGGGGGGKDEVEEEEEEEKMYLGEDMKRDKELGHRNGER